MHHISLSKNTSPAAVKQQLGDILSASFWVIDTGVQKWVSWLEHEQRLFNRGLRLRGQTANMLNSRIEEIKKLNVMPSLKTLVAVKRYKRAQTNAHI